MYLKKIIQYNPIILSNIFTIDSKQKHQIVKNIPLYSIVISFHYLKIIYLIYVTINNILVLPNRIKYYCYNSVINTNFISRFFFKKYSSIRKIKLSPLYITNRVNYYLKSDKDFVLKKSFISPIEQCDSIKKIINKLYTNNSKYSVYTLDFLDISKYFDNVHTVSVHFGDVRKISQQPTLTKTRQITKKNGNNVILKLEKYRHFNFVENDLPFSKKKNMLVYRGGINRVNKLRKYFKENFSSNNLINMDNQFMNIKGQCKYKFILSLEGNDVATNLKWIMSSNSVCFMLKPTCESWFMEGRLIENYHYVMIKNDFSDLEDKIKFYLKNEAKCLQIIKNANQYINQFKNIKLEKKIGLKVFEKYLKNCLNNKI